MKRLGLVVGFGVLVVLSGCSSVGQTESVAKCSPFDLKVYPSEPVKAEMKILSEKIYYALNEQKKVRVDEGQYKTKSTRPYVRMDLVGLTVDEELYLGRRMVYSAGYVVLYSCSVVDFESPEYVITGELSRGDSGFVYDIKLLRRGVQILELKS